MVAYTDSLGFYKNSVGFTAGYTDHLCVAEIDINFATIAAARTAAGATALAATDTLDIATLPKGALLIGGAVTLVTAEGAAGTIDVGMVGALTLFVDDFDLNAAVGTTVGTAVGTSNEYLTADTAVRLLINSNNVDKARVKIVIVYINMGADLGTIPSA